MMRLNGKTYYHFFMLCLLCGMATFRGSSQTSTEALKRRQRTIFIFNFADQIGWRNNAELETFTIGVLGADPVIIDLSGMAQRRTISGKPVEILRFQNIKDITDIQLLYVNRKYGYDVNSILNKIRRRNILLVTENYDYNKSMINMLNVDDRFMYEINTARIEAENFAIAPSLKTYAISSSDKWKKLYEKTRSSLQKTEADVEEKNAIIHHKEEELEGIVGQIESKDHLIQELSDKTELQSKKYEEKIKIETLLEARIQKQLSFIKKQRDEIKNYSSDIVSTNAEIAKQKVVLGKLEKDIQEKEVVLDAQNATLHTQKQFIGLLAFIVVVILLAVFIVYKSFLTQKRLREQLQVKNTKVMQQAEALKTINAELLSKNYQINKQAKKLVAQNDELEQFAYIASHDLQEPLNTISGFIGLLITDYRASFDEVGKNSLDYINAASIRMKKLINALLEYSRLGRSKDFVTVDCNVLLQELQADLKSVIEKTRTNLHVADLPTLNGSEIELRLLFQNLMSNAIKFTKPEVTPKVEIGCQQVTLREANGTTGTYWEFFVKDNGIGIPEHQKNKVFDIFQRLHTREEYKGTGIGLAHCKKIIASHGGKLWVESQQDVGSVFYFTIPIKK